ncbi:pupal cuticle protein Edg-78E-like [Topomyia yanbarensis]|uniref:pupal cuticle protein Edg-78E-like n=1 Tax=Topomyia yanbarensis TaxID=2498891 RepID=UPI00273B7F57|nr:pupal cuticle protein Edg-78E-like [Topomyia yanbarensis]
MTCDGIKEDDIGGPVFSEFGISWLQNEGRGIIRFSNLRIASKRVRIVIQISIFGALMLITFSCAQQVEIVEHDQNINPDGSYFYNYQLTDGTHVQEQGVGGQSATGAYKYTSPEGEVIQITYTADENGFNPQGDAIPQPPPIPDSILRALEYIRTHSQPIRK